MQIVKQISVIVDNAPGTLARICSALQEQEVNVKGFACWGGSDHGIVRMVCDRPLKALDVLEEAGMIALSKDVLEISRDNRPGELHELAARLNDAGVNIDYAYGSSPDDSLGAMYLCVSDTSAARKALK